MKKHRFKIRLINRGKYDGIPEKLTPRHGDQFDFVGRGFCPGKHPQIGNFGVANLTRSGTNSIDKMIE
jgi:hypothetical protein